MMILRDKHLFIYKKDSVLSNVVINMGSWDLRRVDPEESAIR